MKSLRRAECVVFARVAGSLLLMFTPRSADSELLLFCSSILAKVLLLSKE